MLWIDAIFLPRREPGPAGGLRGGIGLAKDKPGHSPLTLGPEGSGQGWGLTHFVTVLPDPIIIGANFQSQ